MPKLPVVSGQKAVKTLSKLGFEAVRQRRSHVVMKGRGLTGPFLARPERLGKSKPEERDGGLRVARSKSGTRRKGGAQGSMTAADSLPAALRYPPGALQAMEIGIWKGGGWAASQE